MFSDVQIKYVASFSWLKGIFQWAIDYITVVVLSSILLFKTIKDMRTFFILFVRCGINMQGHLFLR